MDCCELKELKKKKKAKVEQEKNTAKQALESGKKRERKVYDLPGQKRDPPVEVWSLIHPMELYSLLLINWFTAGMISACIV